MRPATGFYLKILDLPSGPHTSVVHIHTVCHASGRAKGCVYFSDGDIKSLDERTAYQLFSTDGFTHEKLTQQEFLECIHGIAKDVDLPDEHPYNKYRPF